MRDLPNGWYSVSWDKDRWVGVYKRQSFEKLFDIIVEHVHCPEFSIGFDYRNRAEALSDTMHINTRLLYQADGIKTLTDHLMSMDICIDGVAFPNLEYAEKFKKFLEQRYIFNLLKHDYGMD